MNLYLMRHAKPVHGHPLDGTRELTDEGKVQAVRMAEWLTGLIGRVDIVITSPMKRAQQTAAIMAEALGSHMADSKMLEPDQSPGDAWKEIERLAQQSKDVLIVGHDPNINKILCWLQDEGEGDHGPESIRFEWGSIAYLKVSGDIPTGRLQWLVNPSLVLLPEPESDLLEVARELAQVL